MPARETVKASPRKTAVKTGARTVIRTARKIAAKTGPRRKTPRRNPKPNLRPPQHPPVLIKRGSVFLQAVCPRRERGTSAVLLSLFFLRRKYYRRRAFAACRDYSRSLGRPPYLRREHALPFLRAGLSRGEELAVADLCLTAYRKWRAT